MLSLLLTGYSSDTENYTQKYPGRSSLSDIDGQYQASKAGILATPLLIHSQFMQKENKKNLRDENIKSGKTKLKDDKIFQRSGTKLSQHLDKNIKSNPGATKTQGKSKPAKMLLREEEESLKGPQCVQKEQADWYSCSDISASGSFVGFYLFNKSSQETALSPSIERDEEHTRSKLNEDIIFMKSNKLGLQSSVNCLMAQEATQNNKDCDVELCEVQKHTLESFAAGLVGKICKAALSRQVNASSKEFAKEYVADLIRLAKCKLIEEEKLKSKTEEKGTIHMDEIESPSFSKVWKYSRNFSVEIAESLKSRDPVIRDGEADTDSNSREKEKPPEKNDCEFEDLLERNMIVSLESSNEVTTTSSSNSSSQSIHLNTRNESAQPSPMKSEQHYASDKELVADYTTEKGAENFQTTNENMSETKNMLYGNSDRRSKEITSQGTEEKKFEESRENGKSALINDALLGDPARSNHQENECTNHPFADEVSCGNVTNAKDTKGKPKSEVEIQVSDLSDDAITSIYNAESWKPKGESLEKSLPSNKEISDISNNKMDTCFRRRACYKRTMSESQASERKRWSPFEFGDNNLHSFHSSALQCMATPKYVRSSSCPVVSEVSVNI